MTIRNKSIVISNRFGQQNNVELIYDSKCDANATEPKTTKFPVSRRFGSWNKSNSNITRIVTIMINNSKLVIILHRTITNSYSNSRFNIKYAVSEFGLNRPCNKFVVAIVQIITEFNAMQKTDHDNILYNLIKNNCTGDDVCDALNLLKAKIAPNDEPKIILADTLALPKNEIAALEKSSRTT